VQALVYITATGVVGTNANTYLTDAGICQFSHVQSIGAAGSVQGFAFRVGVFGPMSGSASRWGLQKYSDAETGANAGASFYLTAYSDAGGSIDAPIIIVRPAAGVITLGGGGRPITLALTDGGLRINGQTNGAGAGAGTLTNAHAAGNPSFWLPVNIAGAMRYIPCWS
jgi:hypothetical protein